MWPSFEVICVALSMGYSICKAETSEEISMQGNDWSMPECDKTSAQRLVNRMFRMELNRIIAQSRTKNTLPRDT